MKKLFVTLCVVTLVLGISGNAMALNITTTADGNALAGEILGSGMSITNITYTGASNASGYFSDGIASGIGMESGIILTTGTATDADGSNVLDNDFQIPPIGITTINNLPGDADLDALIPGYKTYDATVLEFDFESVGEDVYFNYVFASEEYNEYVSSEYNDVFGFFMDGVNIALVPGTTTPVAINNVNSSVNSTYYKNNAISAGAPYDTEYDGFTTVLTASFTGLTAGTHHMKLAIADAGDMILDTAVFIQAGTFSNVPIDPEPDPEPNPDSEPDPTPEPNPNLDPDPDPDSAPVPEPSTLLFLGAGLIGLVGYRLKRRI